MESFAAADALTNLYEAYSRLVEGLSDEKVTFLMRAVLLLGIPTLIARGLFALGNREVSIQVFAVVLGSLFAFKAPLEAAWFQKSAIRVSWVTLAATALVFLPWAYSAFLVRQRGIQQRISYAVYALLVIGFLVS